MHELGHIVLSVIKELEIIAPVVAVQGNVDEDKTIHNLPIKHEIVVRFE